MKHDHRADNEGTLSWVLSFNEDQRTHKGTKTVVVLPVDTMKEKEDAGDDKERNNGMLLFDNLRCEEGIGKECLAQ